MTFITYNYKWINRRESANKKKTTQEDHSVNILYVSFNFLDSLRYVRNTNNLRVKNSVRLVYFFFLISFFVAPSFLSILFRSFNYIVSCYCKQLFIVKKNGEKIERRKETYFCCVDMENIF